jgi:hypothetical protein
MLYLKTFESYLKGHRSPLYHFTKNLFKLIEDDILNPGQPTFPKNIKAICLTRFPGYTEAGSNRLQLDTDKLIKAGFKPYPVDEMGLGISGKLKKWKQEDIEVPINKINAFLGYSKPFMQGLKFTHGVKGYEFLNNGTPYIPTEFEFEERIYKPIPNIGKYIQFIDLHQEPNIEKLEILKNYIKKYPHIIVRKLKYKWITTGKINRQVPLEIPTEIILNINMIK